jgi:phosphatidylglycerophosphate synthase
VLQLVSVSVLLLAHALNFDYALPVAAHNTRIIGLGLFAAAAALTAFSGGGYLVKYWSMFTGKPGAGAGNS